MDNTSLLVIIWIIFIIIGSVTGKKKKKPSQVERPPEYTQTSNTNFNIPTLANDPNAHDEEISVFRNQERSAEVNQLDYIETYQQRRNEAQEKISRQTAESNLQNSKNGNNAGLTLNLTAESAVNAIILSEIFGKPKALRRRF